MAIGGRVELEGMKDLRARIAQLGVNIKDVRRPSKNVGEMMLASTHQRMARGLDVHGQRLKSDRASRQGHQPLRGLADSVHYAVDQEGLALFSSDIRAGVHFRGDTIVPKRARFLTIPLRARGGESAGGAGLIANRTGRRARHYKNTFFLRKNGKLLLMQRTPGGALRALFLLVKKVKLKKNEWLGWSREDLNRTEEIYAKHLDTFESKGGAR